MDISQFDFEYLRPPQEASFLNHTTDYIKSGSGKTAKRKIFYNTPFDTSELQAVTELENLLQKQGVSLPPQWNKSETLKYLYTGRFDMNASAKMIRSCLQWRSDSRSYIVTPAVKQYYEAGIIYLFGIDYHFRPILIINLNKLKTSQVDESSFDAALAIMMDVLRSYCFIPRKIENWVIIVDAQNVKNLDSAKLKPIIYLTKSCFPSSLEKLFVISSPNLFEAQWDTIQDAAGGDLPEEIHLLSNTDLFKLQTFIPPDSLEKKYGGVCQDVEKYWPPPARHVAKRGSVTGLSEYSDPNNSNFLNESFRTEPAKNFDVNESAIPKNYNPAPQIQNQPKQQNNQRHTVAGGVPNDLIPTGGSRNEFERRSQNDIRSLPSTGAVKEPREEEFIRNLIYTKSPPRGTATQMKPESQQKLNLQQEYHSQGSYHSLQAGPQSHRSLPAEHQKKSSQSGVPIVQAGHVDDDVMSIRSMSSTGSRRSREVQGLNKDVHGLYERSLIDQVNNRSLGKIAEPNVALAREESIRSFHGDVADIRNSSRNSLNGNYDRPIVEPERAKRTVNAGVPTQEYQSLNQSAKSPFVEGASFRDTMESPHRKSLASNRGDTIHIEGSWRNQEERATKNPYNEGPQEFRRKLIENSTNNSDDEEDDRDRFCGLCIRRSGTKKKPLTARAGKNVYE